MLADFIYGRVCELKCEKFLTRPQTARIAKKEINQVKYRQGNPQIGGLSCLFLCLASGLRCNFFIWFFYLLRFPFGKFPLSFLTLIEGKNIGENAPR